MLKFIREFVRWLVVSDYYVEGWDAYWTYADEGDNPYNEGTYAYMQWEYGWTQAQDDHEANPCGVSTYD